MNFQNSQNRSQSIIQMEDSNTDFETSLTESRSSLSSESNYTRLSESAIILVEGDSDKERRRNLLKQIVKKSIVDLKGDARKTAFRFNYKELKKEFSNHSIEELERILAGIIDPVVQKMNQLSKEIVAHFTLYESYKENGKQEESNAHDVKLKDCLQKVRMLIESSTKSKKEQGVLFENLGINMARRIDESGMDFKKFIAKYKAYFAGGLSILGGFGVMKLVEFFWTSASMIAKGGTQGLRGTVGGTGAAISLGSIAIGVASALFVGVAVYYLLDYLTKD